MKVLAVFYDKQIGGGQKALSDWVYLLEREGINVDIFQITFGSHNTKQTRIRGVVLSFLKYYKDGGYDVAVGTLFGIGKLFALIHILTFGCFKYYYREATNIDASRNVFGKFITWVIIALSERTIFNSLEQKKAYQFFQNKTMFIPNYIPIASITRRTDKSLVMVGRCSRVKRFEAGLILLRNLPGFTLNIYTTSDNTDYLEELRSLSFELNISDRMIITLDETDKDKLYRHDILLVMSKYEGNPNVISEALVRGLPVVTSDFKYGIMDLFDSQYMLILPSNSELEPDLSRRISLLHRTPATLIRKSFLNRKINESVLNKLKFLFNG